YGDIPYSEAHDVANPTPVYDDDQAIYRDLYVQLDEAIALINSADGDDRAVGGEDPVFNGNMQSWVRFANSIKLRLLLRESGVAASQGYITGKFAELATADFISADVTINPGYTGAQANQQNPFYRSYGFGIDGTTPGPNRTAVVASSHAVDYLNGGANNSTGGSTVFDPRLMRLFESIYANWDDSTDPTDIVASDAAAFNDFNYAADFFGATQGELGDSDTPEKLSFLGPGLIKSSSQDGYMMLLAESLLLQSEAVTRGYMAGDAAALYNSAIAASFATLGVPTADPRPTGQTFDTDGNPATPPVNFHPVADPNYPTLATYMASIAGTQLDYNTATNKIEAIMTQKWIALMGINGIESFIEYTRTGFPVTPLSETATRPTKPRRLLYPASEFQGNAANAPVQSVDQAFSTGPFWYVGS
ncbi:MAG: SusD/RagB family nutrient-binding outer membrane lipoprotein, partial [Pedobacter sp.]